MFSILAGDALDEVPRWLAIASGEGAGQGHASDAVFLDRVDLEQVFGNVIEGSDDDHGAGGEIGHGSAPAGPSVRHRHGHRSTGDVPFRGTAEPGQDVDKHEIPPWLHRCRYGGFLGFFGRPDHQCIRTPTQPADIMTACS